MKAKYPIFSAIVWCVFFTAKAQAAFLDDIGFTDLKLKLGTGLPDGSSVAVTQTEAPDDATTPSWVPDITSGQFASKVFYDRTPGSDGISSHATSVAMRFYGSTVSVVSAVGIIDLYEAGNWVGSGFLNAGAPGPIDNSIEISATRLANLSWEANWTTWNPEVLRRIDFLAEVDDYIQVVGVGTNTITSPVPSNSFNAIVSGISAGTGVTGTAATDATYVSGRAKPDLVEPESSGSASAARTSSAAVLLMDYAHENPSLSHGSTNNRNGDTIYNAEMSETIKALLMAGADRETAGNTNAVDITDYRSLGNQTSNGLDTRFGAGQVNLYNSYHLLAAGEQDSVEDGGVAFTHVGFDYDSSFGGLNSSNTTATYSFTTSAISGQKLKAALVWNLDVLTTATDNFYDLDLQLIDVTGGGTEVVISNSNIDNTENLWVDLLSDRNYQLKVIKGAGQADFDWDYALAWQLVVPGVTVVETGGSTVTTEDGSTDTFTLVLDSPPTDDVVIDIASSDANEATVLLASVTFTSANWSTLQTVTVTGVNDVVDDGDVSYGIDFTVNSTTDTNYDGITVAGIVAGNTDNDATFSFVAQSDAALSSLATSDTVVITGLLSSSVISITGGEYSINGGAYISTDSLINNGDSVTVQMTSSATGLTAVDAMLTIGDVSKAFTVTTEADTDADGVGDSTDIDDDNDGLDDTYELVLGTDPLIIDTDNDGFTDGEEVIAGTDPLDINSMPAFSDADVNNDGQINVADIAFAQQILMGDVDLTSTHLNHGDVAPLVNGIPSPDGLFTAGDLLVIQRKVMGEINF
ncbi:MAG: hypothetical protein OQK32_06995 [Gammaproteobacteria bacterium]|nr:hypothetical protein [Gammaproteobacteria bacterium]MCW8924073.1 hypothetical protein [Gammaproteobacteria bacterium]